MGSRSREGSSFGVKVVVKVGGQGRGVKVRVMIGGHKVGGQGQEISHGVKSGEGSRLGSRSGIKVWGGVKVWESRYKVVVKVGVKVMGSRSGSWLVVTRSGVKVGGQC